MILAQMQPAAPQDVGIWIAVLAGLLGVVALMLWIASLVKGLLKKADPPDPDKEFVTREELRNVVDEIERRIDTIRKELNDKMDSIAAYQRDTAHRATDAMHAMGLKLERLVARTYVHSLPTAPTED